MMKTNGPKEIPKPARLRYQVDVMNGKIQSNTYNGIRPDIMDPKTAAEALSDAGYYNSISPVEKGLILDNLHKGIESNEREFKRKFGYYTRKNNGSSLKYAGKDISQFTPEDIQGVIEGDRKLTIEEFDLIMMKAQTYTFDKAASLTASLDEMNERERELDETIRRNQALLT